MLFVSVFHNLGLYCFYITRWPLNVNNVCVALSCGMRVHVCVCVGEREVGSQGAPDVRMLGTLAQFAY